MYSAVIVGAIVSTTITCPSSVNLLLTFEYLSVAVNAMLPRNCSTVVFGSVTDAVNFDLSLASCAATNLASG